MNNKREMEQICLLHPSAVGAPETIDGMHVNGVHIFFKNVGANVQFFPFSLPQKISFNEWIWLCITTLVPYATD